MLHKTFLKKISVTQFFDSNEWGCLLTTIYVDGDYCLSAIGGSCRLPQARGRYDTDQIELYCEKSSRPIDCDLDDGTEKRISGLWHHVRHIFAEVVMEWWVFAVELGVPVIIGLAIYLTLRK